MFTLLTSSPATSPPGVHSTYNQLCEAEPPPGSQGAGPVSDQPHSFRLLAFAKAAWNVSSAWRMFREGVAGAAVGACAEPANTCL